MWSIALSLISGGFSKLFGMIPAFLRWCFANPAWVICAVLSVILVFAKADGRHWHKLADQSAASLAVEVGKNKVNLASIAELRGMLDAKNAESDQRAAALAASRAQDAKDVALADQRQKATASRVAVLQGIADHARANPACKAPDALVAALEGL